MVRVVRLRLMLSRDLYRHDDGSETHTLPAVGSRGSCRGGGGWVMRQV